MDVFDLQAKISLDTSGFKKNLDAASGLMSGFGDEIRGIFDDIGSALATAFAVEKVSDFVKGAVTEFGRFEQLIGGIDALFGEDSGKKLKENAAKAFETAGLSANDYMDTATSFAASLIQELGGDTDAAVALVDRAITDMSDNANTMGSDIGSIQNAYKGFAKDNYTMLDNLKLGYGGTKSEMARLINDTGILGDTMVTVSTMTEKGNFDEVVSLEAVIEAVHAKQEELKITGRTAEEAFGTVEGSLNALKAAWSNWKVGLGDKDADMSGLTDNLLETFETAAENVLPVVEQIGESLTTVFSDLTGIDLSGITEGFRGFGDTLSEIGVSFMEGGASSAFETITGKLSELTGLDLAGIAETFRNISETLSGVGAAFADGGIGGVFNELASGFESLTGIDLSGIEESFSGIAEVFTGIADAFAGGGLSGALDTLVSAFEDLTGIDLSGLKDGIGEFLGEIVTVDESTLSSIGGAVRSLIDAFSGTDISGIISGAATAIGDFFGAFDEVAETAVSFVAEIVSQLTRDFEAMAPGIAGVAAGIGIFVGGLTLMQAFSGIPALISAIGTAFSSLNAVMSANPILLVVSVLGSLAAAFVTAYQTNEDFRDSVNNAFETVKTTVSGAVEAVKSWIDSLVEKIKLAISEISAAITNIKEKASEFVSAGKDLIQGLSDGITEKIGEISGGIRKAAGKVVDWFDGVFDRHSPSKVFAEMGRDLMRGLALGIAGEAGNVQRTIDGLRFNAPVIQTGRVDYADSAFGRSTKTTVNGLFAAASQPGGESGRQAVVNLVVDGRTMAQVLFDPLSGVAKQKGVPVGAW